MRGGAAGFSGMAISGEYSLASSREALAVT